MKRATGLFDSIAEPENLLDAYLKARKGKQHRADVISFSKSLDRSIARLRTELISGEHRFDRYRQFTIYDPKERVISEAPFEDRVAHHGIMNLIGPVFEKMQIHDSYACRPKKGTLAALLRGACFSSRYPFYLKLDVRKYFDSIPHTEMKARLALRFREPRLLDLLHSVIDGYRPFSKQPGAGLPIGNLTSQYFANHYLCELDHWIKETLRVKGYVRYMDDFVLWGPSIEVLKAWEARIRNYAVEHLRLLFKPPCINRTDKGLPFLGFVLVGKRLKLSAKSCRRIQRHLRAVESLLDKGIVSQRTAADRVLAVMARTDWTGLGAPLRRRLVSYKIGRRPWDGTASSAAAAGTTTLRGAAPRTATGTTRATATTTWASASFCPAARGKGWISPVEPAGDPVPEAITSLGGESPKGGRVLVAPAEPEDEGSRSPAFYYDDDEAPS